MTCHFPHYATGGRCDGHAEVDAVPRGRLACAPSNAGRFYEAHDDTTYVLTRHETALFAGDATPARWAEGSWVSGSQANRRTSW